MELNEIDALISATYAESDYPVCLSQRKAWSVTRPFARLTVLDATPIFRNTLVKHRALLAGGARLIVGQPLGIPCDPAIMDLLRRSGIAVVSPSDPQPEPVDVVLDCAASFLHWRPRLGAVELTRSGVPKYDANGMPVFVADSSRIKKIETCLGTGESFFRAMHQLGYTDWKGKKLVIFGSGKVGTGLLSYAVLSGARATVVTEPSSVTDFVREKATEIVACQDVQAVARTLLDAHAVVTATGVADALSHPIVTQALLQSDALLANMGVEDEYGNGIPTQRVLSDKRPLNFILDEPTHLRYIDATMGLHNEGINYLLAHPTERGLVEPPLALEEQLLGITRRDGTIGDEVDQMV